MIQSWSYDNNTEARANIGTSIIEFGVQLSMRAASGMPRRSDVVVDGQVLMVVETVLATLATLLLLGIVCGLPFGEINLLSVRTKPPLFSAEDSTIGVYCQSDLSAIGFSFRPRAYIFISSA